MPGTRKAEAKLKRRQDSFDSHGTTSAAMGGQEMKRPGSQNPSK